MRFFVTFGKDKNKNNHIKYFRSKRKLEFSMIVSNKNIDHSFTNYFIKAETWNQRLIDEIDEGQFWKINDFNLRFYFDKQNARHIVFVIYEATELSSKNKQASSKNNLTNDDLEKILNDETKQNEQQQDNKDWELDLDF